MINRRRNGDGLNIQLEYPFIIFVVFLVLKLTSVIDWSWWWVTAPLWGIIPLVILWNLLISGVIFLLEKISRRL